jgi:hypothetical protein
MTTFAFTGPSRLGPRAAAWARNELRAMRRDDPDAIWRSGGALGLDSLVVEEGATVDLIVPATRSWNRDLLALGPRNVVRVPGGYRDRNTELVRGADRLHAFVWSPTFYRSGEWMTINIADPKQPSFRWAPVPVALHVFPDGVR